MAAVRLGELYGLISKEGSYVVNPMYADLGVSASSDRIYFVNDEGKVGYINKAGEEVIPAQFDALQEYEYLGMSVYGSFYDDGYAVIRMGDAFGVIDDTGAYVINPQFDGMLTYTNGFED